jgi:hypothetical protein
MGVRVTHDLWSMGLATYLGEEAVTQAQRPPVQAALRGPGFGPVPWRLAEGRPGSSRSRFPEQSADLVFGNNVSAPELDLGWRQIPGLDGLMEFLDQIPTAAATIASV